MKKLTILLLFPILLNAQQSVQYLKLWRGESISTHLYQIDSTGNVIKLDSAGFHNIIIDIASLDSLFLSTDKPVATWEDIPTTLGMEFKTATSGNITALKFYKVDATAGSYTLTLWALDGSKLFQSVVNVSGIGWKRISCNIPVNQDQPYIVSVYSTLNRYGYTNGSFSIARTRNSLSAYAGRYLRSAGFPASTSTTWYGVDVVFQSTPSVPLSVKTSPDRDATMPKDSVGVSAIATGYTKFQWTVEDSEGRFTLKDTNTLKPYVIPLDSSGCRVWLFCTVTDAAGNQMADAVAIRIAPHPKMVLGYYLIDGTFVWRVPPVFIEFQTPATYVRP